MENRFSAPTFRLPAAELVLTLSRYVAEARPLPSVTHWLWAGLVEQSWRFAAVLFVGVPNAPLRSPIVADPGSYVSVATGAPSSVVSSRVSCVSYSV